MAFEKGRTKTGGRKKGTKPSAKSLRKGLQEAGFDITRQFLDLLSVTTEPRDRLAILKEIARWTQPAPPDQPDDDEPQDDTEQDEAKVLSLLKD